MSRATLITTTWFAVLVLVGTLALGVSIAQAADKLPSELNNVGIDQHLDGQIPPELIFRDEAGRSVRLGDYFGKRPIILVLAYYRCPMLCTQVLNGVVDAMRKLPYTLGNEYDVVTVSFDPRETPELAAAKKASYIEAYGRPETADGWHFLTGDAEPITKLTEAVGFRYAFDKERDQYIHASGIMLLTPDGRLSRYFYGIDYTRGNHLRDLRLGLVESSTGKIGPSAVDAVLLYCFHYNPKTGRYSGEAIRFVRIGGILTLLSLGVFFAVMRWSESTKQRFNSRPRPEPSSDPLTTVG